MWIGRPLLGQWVYDVRRLLDVIQQSQGDAFRPVTLIGQDSAGLVALCAAAVDQEQRIAQVAAVGTLASYVSDVPYEGQRVGVLAPGIVRDVGDVPHLAALALPRRVVIAGGVSGGGELLGEEELSRAYEISRNLATMTNQSDFFVIRANADHIAADLSVDRD
jgi:pimeloyl-ACP methyl ester carboxylesterase